LQQRQGCQVRVPADCSWLISAQSEQALGVEQQQQPFN